MSDSVIFEAGQIKYTLAELVKCFRNATLCSGDSIFVHSELGHFGRLVDLKNKEEFSEAFITAFLTAIGPHGNLIMPTFSYSFCDNERYDPQHTPSKIGVLSEQFRKIPNALRSIQPIFSVAALGPAAEYFVDVSKSSFGKGSIFHKLFEKNVKLVFLGETFDITYMHYIEQQVKVPYRFMKSFSGEIKVGNRIFNDTYDYYVKFLNKNIKYDLEKIAAYFDAKGILSTSKIGYSKLSVVRAVDAACALKEMLKNNIFALLKSVPNLEDIKENETIDK